MVHKTHLNLHGHFLFTTKVLFQNHLNQEASFQAMSKWIKERNRVDEEFCSLLLEIGRLDAKIEYLTVANIALEVEVSSSKEEHLEVKEQLGQMKSLLEPMQNKVMKLKLLLQSKEEKLREKDQVFQAIKEKLTAQNAKSTLEHIEVLEDLKSKSRDQDKSLKQMADRLEMRTTELKFESNQVNLLKQKIEIYIPKIQKLENDLAETEIAKLKEMMQHDMEFHQKNSELIFIQEKLLKNESQKLQAEDDCRKKTVELEDLTVKLKTNITSLEKCQADLVCADSVIVFERTRLADLERKVELMVHDINNQVEVGADLTKDLNLKQGEVDSLKRKLTDKNVEYELKIDMLVKTTKENFAKDVQVKELSHDIRKQHLEHIEYCRQTSEEVQLLMVEKKISESTIDRLEEKNIALAAAEISLVREVQKKIRGGGQNYEKT